MSLSHGIWQVRSPTPCHCRSDPRCVLDIGCLCPSDDRFSKELCYLAPTTGILPFDGLVAEVMAQEPYRSARHVFWVLDNGSSHRGAASVRRLQEAHPNLVAVHLPVHASWLNQVEIYFSILQRKVLTPPDAESLSALAADILAFQTYYELMAEPFEWKFTRTDLAKLLRRMADDADPGLAAA